MASDFILNEKQIAIVSVLELRNKYRQLLKEYRIKVIEIEKAEDRMEKQRAANEEQISSIKEKHAAVLSRTRFNRDKRIDKLTFRLFKGSQKVFALRRDLKKRLAPIRDTKVQNKRAVMKKARARGFKAGMQKSFRIKQQEIYRSGYREGQKELKMKLEQSRRGVVYKSATISSIAQTSVVINKLAKVLNLSAEYVALFLWMGEYDSFFFYELRSAMNTAGEELFYKKVYYLKDKGYVQKIAHKKKGVIWALTPLGREIHNRAKYYLFKFINVK